MSEDYNQEDLNPDNQTTSGDPKPVANTWPKIVAAVASALCTVSSTLFFTMKNQYQTERADKLELIQTNKNDKVAYEKDLKDKQNQIDSCGIKTINQLKEQVQAVKDLKLTVTSNVNEVINDNKITSDNIKNIRKATNELTKKIKQNE